MGIRQETNALSNGESVDGRYLEALYYLVISRSDSVASPLRL